MPIRQLPPDVVAKIAAGEVIERPASVVKELLENSLDAGSTRIDVELEQGGSELIRVVDNGCGIPAEELPLALAAHATSKLREADDLFNVQTLGFRGEALASIAGIARVTIQSRTDGSGAQIDDGIVTPWGGPRGTRITVRHLFYNVPVRKKFLKSQAAELGQVCETITRIALAHPALHITLKHNNRKIYDLPPCQDLTDRIALFFGKEIRDALYEIATPHDAYSLKGFIADPKCDRGNSRLQYFFVNGRWFRDRNLQFAVMDAYRNLLMSGRYPIAFLMLRVPPQDVDVNVHPTKAEVKFRNSATVFSLVRSSVKECLERRSLVPRVMLPAQPIAPPEMPPLPTLFPSRAASALVSEPLSVAVRQGESRVETEAPVQNPSFADTSGTAVQIHDAYLIQETPEGMLVIDQHALHERILFEQMRRRIREGKLEVQRLLIPEPIELPAAQAAALLDVAGELAALGLEISDFGGNTVLLSSFPTLLARRTPREILIAVVDFLATTDRAPSREILLDNLLATMACKAAVKAGDKLSPEEIHHLLHLRGLAEASHHCPHGRPTTLLFSRQDLDRQFRRT